MDNTETKIPQKIDFNNFPVTKEVEPEYFITRNFGEVVADGGLKPQPKKLGGVFLIEDKNTMLFSRTNTGKSILSTQLGIHAATGTSIADNEALINECEPMRTLIADMELEDRDIYNRHFRDNNGIGQHLDLLKRNLFYLHEDPTTAPRHGLDLLHKIEMAAIARKAKLLILDNITKIVPDLLKAEEVTKVIEILKRIRQKTGCSFLVIAHTTKGDPRTAIKPTDYYGSAMIQNFFTEISYLDATRTDDEFMLVHAKTKRKEVYDKTVPIFRRGVHPLTGLGFNFLRFDTKENVSLPESVGNKKGRKIPLTEFVGIIRQLNQTYSVQDIAGLCDCSRQHINTLLKSENFEVKNYYEKD